MINGRNFFQLFTKRISLILLLVLGCICFFPLLMSHFNDASPTFIFLKNNFLRRLHAYAKVLSSCSMRTLSEWITDPLWQCLLLVYSLLLIWFLYVYFDFFYDYFLNDVLRLHLLSSGNSRSRLEGEHHFVELIGMSWLCSPMVPLPHGLHLSMLRLFSFRFRGNVSACEKRVSPVSYTVLATCCSCCSRSITCETIFSQVLLFHYYILYQYKRD